MSDCFVPIVELALGVINIIRPKKGSYKGFAFGNLCYQEATATHSQLVMSHIICRPGRVPHR